MFLCIPDAIHMHERVILNTTIYIRAIKKKIHAINELIKSKQNRLKARYAYFKNPS